MTKTVKDNNPHKVAWTRDANSKPAIQVRANKVSVKMKNVVVARVARTNHNADKAKASRDRADVINKLVEARVVRVVLVLVLRDVSKKSKTRTDKEEHNYRLAQMSVLANLPSALLQRIFPQQERFFVLGVMNIKNRIFHSG